MTIRRIVLATWTALAFFAAHALGQTSGHVSALPAGLYSSASGVGSHRLATDTARRHGALVRPQTGVEQRHGSLMLAEALAAGVGAETGHQRGWQPSQDEGGHALLLRLGVSDDAGALGPRPFAVGATLPDLVPHVLVSIRPVGVELLGLGVSLDAHLVGDASGLPHMGFVGGLLPVGQDRHDAVLGPAEGGEAYRHLAEVTGGLRLGVQRADLLVSDGRGGDGGLRRHGVSQLSALSGRRRAVHQHDEETILATLVGVNTYFAAAIQTAPDRRDVVERVHAACPGLVRQDHAFTDAVATVLHREDGRWGRNAKRGNVNDPSHDALFYRTIASPFGGAVIDIIAAAGGPDARPAWQDVTQATIDAGTVGAWVAPSGVLPACLATGPTPEPDPPLVLPDLEEVLVALSRIENRLAILERAHDAHTLDSKERTDVIRVTLEQLDAWLRGRRVLRY